MKNWSVFTIFPPASSLWLSVKRWALAPCRWDLWRVLTLPKFQQDYLGTRWVFEPWTVYLQ